MLTRIRVRFTKWYIKHGWTYRRRFIFDDDAEYPTIPINIKRCYSCPWWVRPLLIFFSPCTYDYETTGYLSYEAVKEEMAFSIVRRVKELRAKEVGEND